MTASRAKASRYWYLLLIPLLGVVFYLVALKAVDPVGYANSDFFTFWLSGHLAILGQNPYQTEVWVGGSHQFGATWIPNATFIYPLPVSLIFAPLGLLLPYQASVAWIMLSQFMIVASLALLLRLYPARMARRYVLPLAAGLALSYPTLLTLNNGQFSPFILLVVTGIAYFWESGKWWEGSILLPLLALKPNLGVPIVVLLSLYLIFRRQITALALEAASGLVLLSVGWLQDPNWIIEFWRAGNTKLSQTFGFSPTIWGLSSYVCHYQLSCALEYGGAFGAILLTGCVYLAARKRNLMSPTMAISLAVILTCLLTPYTWPYDQLLLAVPIIQISTKLAEEGYAFLPTALLFLAVDILAFVFLGIAALFEMGIWNVGNPVVVLALLLWFLYRKPPRREESPA